MRPRPTDAARVLARAAVVAAALTAAVCPARAQAPELPEDLRSIAAVRFTGLKHVKRHALEVAGLHTRAPSRLPWRERPQLRRDYLRADSALIVSMCRHYGYLDARVAVTLVPGRDPRSAIVRFDVREGPLVRVGRVELEGVRVIPGAELRHMLLAQPKRPFDPAFLQLDALAIRTLYQDRGYSARVDTTARREAGDSTRVDLRYALREGPQYRVGKVDVFREPRARESLVRREMLLRTGDVFSRTRLDLTKEHLYNTGLYRQVQVTTVPDSAAARIDLLVRVSQRAPRWVDIGVGSGSSNRYQVTAQLGHRNIDTHARGIVVDGQAARDGRNRPVTELADVTLSDPWFLGFRLLFQATGLYRRDWDRSNGNFVQDLEKRGFNFSFYHELGRMGRVTLVQENVFARQSYQLLGASSALEDSLAREVVPRYRSNTLRLTTERDTRDDKIVPHRGSYQVLTEELAGGPLKGTNSYQKALFSSTWYSPLANGWMFAARASAGVMVPFGDVPSNFSPEVGLDPQVGRVPLDARFRIGGVNSLRGWPENGVPAGGGLAMALANIEWRIPVAGPFGLEVFVDAGNVWSRPSYVKASDFLAPWDTGTGDAGEIRYAYGAGGRLVLPFGPLRIDLATSNRPDFPRNRFFGHTLPLVYQFAIGPSF